MPRKSGTYVNTGGHGRRSFLGQVTGFCLAGAGGPRPGGAAAFQAAGTTADAPARTELFLDGEFLEMTASVTRRIHLPFKHRLNPVLRPEEWWEGDCATPLAAVYEPDEKLFKIWYRTGPLVHRTGFIDGHASYAAYAVSRDGFHWEKPRLGVVNLAGRRDHNVVMLSEGVEPRFQAQGRKLFISSVVRHPHPRDEREKYVGLYFDMKKQGSYIALSPDGIHWSAAKEPFWQTLCDVAGWGDDSIFSLIYDKFKGRWVTYHRVNPQESEHL